MIRPFVLALGIAAFTSAPANAQQQCSLTYKFFEFAIPHLDLAECPKDIARPGAFCRVTTANDSVHVFVFEEKDQQCLLAVKSYSEYQILVK